VRRIGLKHIRFAEATCGTLRRAILKIGARITVSARRIKLAMISAHPWRDERALVHALLRNAAA
jgi:hypothetical protein